MDPLRFLLAIPTLGGEHIFRLLNSVASATTRRHHLLIDARPWPSVAAKWNGFVEAMLERQVPLVIANDDIILWPGCLDALVSAAQGTGFAAGAMTVNQPIAGEHPRVMAGSEGGFSLFAITPQLVRDLTDHEVREYGTLLGHAPGRFDEGFYPAYFEDNDFYVRMKRAGLRERVTTDAAFYHETTKVGEVTFLGATSTLRDSTRREAHRGNLARNRARYLCKWGGEPHHEQFTLPWNGAHEFEEATCE